jgi:CubicO group peptidase (beta-lactamase class C family)
MIGGAFAVYHEGKPVVDLWGGYADIESRSKWQENTIAMVMSTTKAVGAVCIGMLVDR